MRIFISICICLLYLGTVAQKKDSTTVYLDEHIAITGKKNAVFSAVSVKKSDHWELYAVYPDAGALLIMSFKDQKLQSRDGEFIAYYSKKQPWIRGRFKNDEPDGNWIFYYPNGQVKQFGLIENGQMTGIWTSYYETGQVSALEDFGSATASLPVTTNRKDKNTSLLDLKNISSRLDGLSKHYYPGGQLNDSGYYRNNLKEGSWQYFHINGKQKGIGNYFADSLTGTWSWYHANGKPATIELYKSAKLTSVACFDEQGTPTGNDCPVNKVPYPIGAFTNFKLYMENNLLIPDSLRGIIDYGEVVLQATISAEGKLIKLQIVSASHAALAKEAETFFRSFENWSPAILHNMPATFQIEYTIDFNRFSGDSHSP
jgi:antitoxin component YwqK of YwqJK toxin-antitoxin module